VFLSIANLTGRNPDGNIEVFVANSNGSGVIQLTETSGVYHWEPRISENGHKVVFEAETSDLSWHELSVVNSDGSGLTQLYAGGVLEGYSISEDGTKVVCGSSANLTGGNPDGNYDVFIVDPDEQCRQKNQKNS